jgi:hypothetical protein
MDRDRENKPAFTPSLPGGYKGGTFMRSRVPESIQYS